MPFKEKCPVCRIGWRVRPDVKTCSRQCSKEWANWSPEQRAKATSTIDSDAPFTIDESLSAALSEAYHSLSPMAKEIADAEDRIDNPYPEPVDGEDPMASDEAASHIMKILGGDK